MEEEIIDLPEEDINIALIGFTKLFYTVRPKLKKGFKVYSISGSNEYNFIIKAANAENEEETLIIAKSWVEDYINEGLISYGIEPIKLIDEE